MRAKAIETKPKFTEKILKMLSSENLLNKRLKIKKENGLIYIPLKSGNHKVKSFKIIEKDFEINKEKPKSISDIIDIPKTLINKLPTSYDIVGDIILIKLENELMKYKEEIGKSLLTLHGNIHTICLSKPVKGEYRTRDIEIIAGEKKTSTIHKEYGLKFEVDIKKTYFSPRLSSERKRVADLVKPGEVVVDMFAGVAPFSIMIAKYANPKVIYSLDKNLHAIKYAKRNIKKNKVLDKVEAIHLDVNNISQFINKKGIKADRIVMNLPFLAHLFFKNTLEIINTSCIIHYYDILKEKDIGERINYLKKLAAEKNISLIKMDVRKIKTYAPREIYIGIDIKAKKNADVA